jgi:outer membrane murein-binding lipoprotein Lpp
MQQGRRAGRATMVAAIVGLCALAGCSSSQTDAGVDQTTTSASSSTTSTTTANPSSAVLAAYRAASTAFVQALATANPNDPALEATMVDPELVSIRANLVGDQQKGIVGRGAVTLHPKLVSLSATTASVVDCAYSTSELIYQATGKPVPPVTPPENDGVSATLVLTGGTWKLSKQTVTEGKCAPGS